MNTDALWHTTSNDNEHKDFHPFGFLVHDCLFMQKQRRRHSRTYRRPEGKTTFQGIWVDSDEENVVFKVKGDTIYYPDSLSQPIKFAIYGDTLELKSANDSKYAILKQSAHIFEFKNSNGDIVKLIKGEDPSFELQFANKKPTSVNQNKTIKSDTILFCNNERYHSYIQVNPTTYKVFKTS